MGVYFGYIDEPTTKDKKLLTVPDDLKLTESAAPYKGPARPPIQY